jgi:acyl-coenzyme A synthetase/AMP-(fatty) acid ligase
MSDTYPMRASGNFTVQLLALIESNGWQTAIAIRQDDRTVTFAELASMVRKVSSVIQSFSIVPGERVALLMRDTVEAVASILGVIHAGCVAVPLSELVTADDVKKYLRHCGAVVAIVDVRLEPVLDEVRVELPSIREVMCVGVATRPAKERGERDFWSLVAKASAAAPIATTDTDNAVMLYSAGFASSDLRAVPHSARNMLSAFASCGQALLQLAPSDVVLSVARLSTAYGLGIGLLFPLLAGAQVTLFPQQPKSDALLAQFAAVAPTVFIATPSIYSQLAADVLERGTLPVPLAGLRLAVAGAEGMPERLIAKIRQVLGTEVLVGYGLSELFQFAMSARSDEAGAAGAVVTRPHSPAFAGSLHLAPLVGVQARIVDEDGHEVQVNDIGTLQLESTSVFAGYWPVRADNQVGTGSWFTTHDRFLVDANGVYYHCGRVDDLFKVGGKWVSPQEVERALTAHEAVWQCAVIGAEDEEGLTKPLAFVVINVGHQDGPALESELKEYVKSVLSPYKYPRWIDFVDALPRGPGGKVLRYKLRPQRRRRRAETGHQ